MTAKAFLISKIWRIFGKMAIYRVGANDGNIFKKRTTWDFIDAINAANAGDIIEIEEKFQHVGNERININKDLTIVGVKTEDNIIPTLFNNFLIEPGVSVTFKRVHIYNSLSRNTFNVKENAKVSFEEAILENSLVGEKIYPIIYSAKGSQVVLKSCSVYKPESENYNIHAESSNLVIEDTYLQSRISANHSKISFTNVEIEQYVGNTLRLDSSEVFINQSTIQGGNTAKNFPCVWVRGSNIKIENSLINQANYSAALHISESSIEINTCTFDSVYSISSKLNFSNFVAWESLVLDRSTFLGEDFIIAGKDNGKINFYASNKSAIQIDGLSFGNLSNPNIRLSRDTEWKVSNESICQYDAEQDTLILDDKDNFILTPATFSIDYFGEKTSSETLEEMIGLSLVKSQVKEFIAMAQINKKRAEQGLATSIMTLHSLFLGNPGTGKTTVARLIGSLLYEKGIVKSDKFVETSRSDLVGKYIGHTALKTKEVLESARGGVLFIDEAYTLSTGGEEDFGIEAINEILKFMEDNRQDIVIIFAGYTDDMNHFLDMNEGLKSRIPNVFDFEDYTIEQLTQIGLNELDSKGLKVNQQFYEELVRDKFAKTNDFSNGRWIRNINEKLLKKQAIRFMENEQIDLTTITDEDITALMAE